MFGVGPKEHSASATILAPTASGDRELGAGGLVDAECLAAVLRLREHIGEGEVGEVVAVGVDIDTVDRVWMERVRIGVCVEDDYCPVPIGK